MSLCSAPLPPQSRPEDAPGRGTPALIHPERRGAPRREDTPREGGGQRTQLTQAWSLPPGAHMWAHSEMETLSFLPHTHTHACAHTYKSSDVCTLRQGDPNHHSAHPLSQYTYTYTHTHTHGPTQTNAYGASWTHTDLHTHSSRPHSISLGCGQFCNPYGAQTQLRCAGASRLLRLPALPRPGPPPPQHLPPAPAAPPPCSVLLLPRSCGLCGPPATPGSARARGSWTGGPTAAQHPSRGRRGKGGGTPITSKSPRTEPGGGRGRRTRDAGQAGRDAGARARKQFYWLRSWLGLQLPCDLGPVFSLVAVLASC